MPMARAQAGLGRESARHAVVGRYHGIFGCVLLPHVIAMCCDMLELSISCDSFKVIPPNVYIYIYICHKLLISCASKSFLPNYGVVSQLDMLW
jgi:hypothetical protein